MAQSHTREVYADGSIVYSNLFNDIGVPLLGNRKSIEARVITHYWDGTPMIDDKVDNKLYSKIGNEYIEYLFPFWGENFLEKDTMGQMRAMEPWEIVLLRRGYWKGVRLNGYYSKGDTPAPIEYTLSNSLVTDNGGSVIEVSVIKLVHDFVSKVDVSYFGAKDNVEENQAPFINKALDVCKDCVISKKYYISADSNTSGILLKSGMKLVFTGFGQVNALPSSSDNYQIIRIYDADDVYLGKPIVYGERLQHTGTTGEWGHGIAVLNSKKVVIDYPQVFDCWGDGIYVGNQYWDTNSSISTDGVKINYPVIDNVRRNGISLTSNKNIDVLYPRITRVNGIAPQAGIDIEPEGLDGLPIVIDNINIVNPYTEDCAGSGIMMFLTNHVLPENNPSINVNIINHTDSKSRHGFSILGSGNIDGLTGYIKNLNPLYLENKASGIVVENWGEENAPNLLIDAPKIVDWCKETQSFEPDRHGIVFRKTVGTYRNVNITVRRPYFERKTNSISIFPIYVYSVNPVKKSVIIDGIEDIVFNNKIIPKVIGAIVNDYTNKSKGEYWETTQLAQRVFQARFLSTYTNKNINTAGNAIFNIEGNTWSEGQRLTFLVENNTSTLIVKTDGSTVIRPTILGGNLGSNTIGDRLVLEFRGNRWFIVEEVGRWRDVSRSNELFIISQTEPINKAPFLTWVDTTSNRIKIRNLGNDAWVDLTMQNATETVKGLVSRSAAIGDVGTPNATDLPTAITLVNRLSQVVQAMLTTDRASGQRSSS